MGAQNQMSLLSRSAGCSETAVGEGEMTSAVASVLLPMTLLAPAACMQPSTGAGSAHGGEVLVTLDGTPVSPAELEALIEQVTDKANVAGLSVAIISDGQQWDQAFAESETRFFVQGEDTRVAFVGDAAGMVSGFNLEMSGLVLPARKVR